ncbi:MAG: stage II sporulation protein R [Clostridia bacterium]|nr:stage II sporulation protein R [Clostridia bacterium]
MKTKIFELSVFISLFLCIIGCVSFENNCDDIRHNLLRLHVIASGDTKEEQELKLKVRDAILEKGADVFSQNDTLKTAESKIKDNINLLKETAESTIRENGYTYSATVELTKSYFPTRQYENITLPAGYYNAVKVIIGEGEGQNWWCVMFPPMCLPAASGNEKELKDVLNEKEMDIVTGGSKYEVRFWIVEKWQELKARLESDQD